MKKSGFFQQFLVCAFLSCCCYSTHGASHSAKAATFTREGIEIYIPFDEWVPEPFFHEKDLIRLPQGLETFDLIYGKAIKVFGVGSLSKKRKVWAKTRKEIPLQPKKECSNQTLLLGSGEKSQSVAGSLTEKYLNIPHVTTGHVLEINLALNADGKKPFVRGQVSFSIQLPGWETSQKELFLVISSKNLDGNWSQIRKVHSLIENNGGGVETLEIESRDIPIQSKVKLDFYAPKGASIKLWDARLFGVSRVLSKKNKKGIQ